MATSRICSIPDCGKAGELRRGLCYAHYKRFMRYGDPLAAAARKPRFCVIADCGQPYLARGYCTHHYNLWRNHGSADAAPATRPAQAYFRQVVLSYSGQECLIWPFLRNADGRAKITVNGRPRLLSRIVCLEANGPPPTPQHHAAHSCGKSHLGCVAKTHLSWKTPIENEADKLIHGTARYGEKVSNARLTLEDARKVLSMKGSDTERNIAKLFGISRSSVHLIHTGKMWRRALAES